MELKVCSQCGRPQQLSQYRSRPTKRGISYRPICHQCEYANHIFTTLSKEKINTTADYQ